MNVWIVTCVFICGINAGALGQMFVESRRRAKEAARAAQSLAAWRERLDETGAPTAGVPE